MNTESVKGNSSEINNSNVLETKPFKILNTWTKTKSVNWTQNYDEWVHQIHHENKTTTENSWNER